ncbi:MAG: FAD-dependent oxidoreductase [Parvibaculum sp.]|nr:FAD-dependent oxidoreductase [Parvibaculum sp.]
MLGAGLAGCVTALALARKGCDVDLIDEATTPISQASLHNEGKLHLGYVYAADDSRRTCPRMIEGALSFLPILSKITGVPSTSFARSQPFLYGVPADSQKSPDEIAAHFDRVDRAIADFRREQEIDSGVGDPAPHRQLATDEVARWFDLDLISAAFATDERSVDTVEIADLVAACVYAEPLIVLRLGTTVKTAEAAPGKGWDVICSSSSGTERSRYTAVVNALWADRLRLDAEIGLHPGRSWLLRYKAALTLDAPDTASTVKTPSVTLIVGPYGDFVNHGGGRFYLSWYPVCKLAETRGADPRPLLDIAHVKNAGSIASASLGALARYMPSLSDLAPALDRMRVGGGVIAAWGETDIDDPASGLHERHEIGPTRHGSWVTLDTGKYCTAPLYALRAADLVLEALA